MTEVKDPTVDEQITEYLSGGGLFNPELMPHDKVRDLLVLARSEIERLRERTNKQAMILRRLTPENFPGTLFIHADGGTKDINGMPERLYVVPAYGCDWSQVYERTDKVTGPEW